MNRIAVVVEDRSDALLLRKLLGKDRETPLRFFAAGEGLSLATVGRNILVHDGDPVLVVTDSGTLEPSRAEDSRRLMGVALKHVAPDDWFEVVSILPELEALFFEAPGVLERRFGPEAVDRSTIERGRYRPKATLDGLLKAAGIDEETYLRELTIDDVVELRRGEQAARLILALENLAVGVGG